MYTPGRWKIVVIRGGNRISESAIMDLEALENAVSLASMTACPGDVVEIHCLSREEDTIRKVREDVLEHESRAGLY